MKLKDKEGNELTTKEYIQRFKRGVEMITPLQQIKVSLFGIFIILIGICFGLYAGVHNKIWWLVIILTGSLFLSLVNLLGTYQKYIALKKVMIYKEVENEQVSTS